MSTPAGWYPDTEVAGGQRYWDGSAWTEHRAALATAEQTAVAVAAGWYPDTQATGGQRYWDGTEWTEHRTHAAPGQPSPAPLPGAAPSRSIGVKLLVTGVIVVVIGVVAVAIGSIFSYLGATADFATDYEYEGESDDEYTQDLEPERTPIDSRFDINGDGEVTLEESEEFAANFPGYASANGTYIEASNEVASAFGMTIVWEGLSDPEGTNACGPAEEEDALTVAGSFCPKQPTIVYINTEQEGYSDFLESVFLVDVVKHEIAHHIINERCGMTDPWVTVSLGVDHEGVTDSYIYLYMGAYADGVDDLIANTFSKYHINADTYEAARLIREGQCDPWDGETGHGTA